MRWKGWVTMTLQFTFENAFRERLLDIIYGQWALLGIPFSQNGYKDEVIDPEALIWCSLEYFPEEPRLCELVQQWLYKHSDVIIRHRINGLKKPEDLRLMIWGAIDKLDKMPLSSEPNKSFSQTEKFIVLLSRLHSIRQDQAVLKKKIGRLMGESATLLLRTRALLGMDVRHFLLVHLLAFPLGGTLKDLAEWSGYQLRALTQVYRIWEDAGLVKSSSGGNCRLLDPGPFRELFKIPAQIVIFDWRRIFETSVRLLRDLAKARSKGFDEGSVVVLTLLKEAKAAIREAAWRAGDLKDTSVYRLLEIFPE